VPLDSEFCQNFNAGKETGMYGPQSMFPPEGADPRQLVRTMQIICGALMMGVLSFAFVAAMVRFGQADQPPAAVPMIAYFAAGMAAMAILVRLIAGPLVVRAGLKQITTLRPIAELGKLDLYGVYQTQMIVSCAVLEGAAFFNLIGVIIDGQLWSFGVVALLLVLMAISFPTYERVDAWADEQLRLLQLDPPR
jgi:hypothetical protein